MDLRINPGPASAAAATSWQLRQSSYKDLGAALQSGNLDAAQSAYAKMTTDAARFLNQHPDSPVARLGKALAEGNIAWAQSAYGHMHVRQDKDSKTPTPLPPATDTLGRTLNLVV